MGWFGCHLYEFRFLDKISKSEIRIGLSDEEDVSFWGEQKRHIDWKEKIVDYFTEQQKKARYDYDFGNSWEHDVVLEKIIEAEKGGDYPVCLAGKMACPLEDVGRLWGYYDFS